MEQKNNFYKFQKYCGKERWNSFWHQIDEVLRYNPERILEIGVGPKIFETYIKHLGIGYVSMDISKELGPDIIGSVDNIPLKDRSFDVVCAFEVLEHLPFKDFSKSLKEMGRVSKGPVLISLPHWGRHFSVQFRLPYFKKIEWQYKFNLFPIGHDLNGEHHWEIGKKGYPLKRIKDVIRSEFVILNDYIVFDFPYHHFFILERKS